MLAKNSTESICANDVLGIRARVLFEGDCNPANNDTDHCLQLIGFDTATPTPCWKVSDSWGADWSELNSSVDLVA